MNRKIFFLAASLLLPLSLFSEDKRGPFFFAAPVYWRADGDGLAFAVKNHSSIKNLAFDWDFGFEIGFGYRIPHDWWSLSLGLKHIHTNAHGEEKRGKLFPVWTLPSSGFANRVHAHWRLHLGLLDCLLSKEWKMSPRVTLTPKLGLRSAWIRQKYNLEYFGGTLPAGEDAVRMKNKFWGIGPMVGACGSWEMVKHFSLFGDALFSLLYGQFYLHQDEDTGAKDKLLGVHNIFKSSAWTADFSIGLKWHQTYTGALKKVMLAVAWDQIFLYKQNQLIRFVSDSAKGLMVANRGDLSLMGVHVEARFDF